MEANHFSHNHALVFQQLPQGYQPHCSGCKSPASGNVYGCRQCSYFLHEECYRAPRSMYHPSHPIHPLTLMPFPTYPSRSFSCNSCSLYGEGFSYSCSLCEFDLHVRCTLGHAVNPHSATPYPAPAAGFPFSYPSSYLPGQHNQVAPVSAALAPAPQKVKREDEEARVRKMEAEAELRRRRHELTMQRLQQASDSIDAMGRIG